MALCCRCCVLLYTHLLLLPLPTPLLLLLLTAQLCVANCILKVKPNILKFDYKVKPIRLKAGSKTNVTKDAHRIWICNTERVVWQEQRSQAHALCTTALLPQHSCQTIVAAG